MIRYHLFNMSIAEKMYKATLSQISIFEIIIIVMMSLLPSSLSLLRSIFWGLYIVMFPVLPKLNFYIKFMLTKSKLLCLSRLPPTRSFRRWSSSFKGSNATEQIHRVSSISLACKSVPFKGYSQRSAAVHRHTLLHRRRAVSIIVAILRDRDILWIQHCATYLGRAEILLWEVAGVVRDGAADGAAEVAVLAMKMTWLHPSWDPRSIPLCMLQLHRLLSAHRPALHLNRHLWTHLLLLRSPFRSPFPHTPSLLLLLKLRLPFPHTPFLLSRREYPWMLISYSSKIINPFVLTQNDTCEVV